MTLAGQPRSRTYQQFTPYRHPLQHQGSHQSRSGLVLAGSSAPTAASHRQTLRLAVEASDSGGSHSAECRMRMARDSGRLGRDMVAGPRERTRGHHSAWEVVWYSRGTSRINTRRPNATLSDLADASLPPLCAADIAAVLLVSCRCQHPDLNPACWKDAELSLLLYIQEGFSRRFCPLPTPHRARSHASSCVGA